jgi:hypothetical protein
MESQRAPQKPPGGRHIVERQAMNGRLEQSPALAFHPFHRLKLGPAPTARVGAVEHGAAEGTAIHRSRLEIEQ